MYNCSSTVPVACHYYPTRTHFPLHPFLSSSTSTRHSSVLILVMVLFFQSKCFINVLLCLSSLTNSFLYSFLSSSTSTKHSSAICFISWCGVIFFFQSKSFNVRGRLSSSANTSPAPHPIPPMSYFHPFLSYCLPSLFPLSPCVPP